MIIDSPVRFLTDSILFEGRKRAIYTNEMNHNFRQYYITFKENVLMKDRLFISRK